MSDSPATTGELGLAMPEKKAGVQKGAALSVAALVIGLATAISGVVIELASGFLGDLRHGVCVERMPGDTRPLWHATFGGGIRPYNRMRCCGGAASVDHATQECRALSIISSTAAKRFAYPIHNVASFGKDLGTAYIGGGSVDSNGTAFLRIQELRPPIPSPQFLGLVVKEFQVDKAVDLHRVDGSTSGGHVERAKHIDSVVEQDAFTVRTHMSHLHDPAETWAEEAASGAHRAVLAVEKTVGTVEEAVNEDIVQTQTESAGNLDPIYEWVPWDRALLAKGRSTALFISIIGSCLLAVCAGLLTRSAIAAKGSGIPEVRASVAGFSLPKHFSSQTLIVKVFALSMVVGAGLAVGKEGPMIHIGACWACLLAGPISRILGLSQVLPDTELICVGAAAGVSAAFGAPLAGVLFAVEELGTHMAGGLRYSTMLCAFGSAVVACLALKWLDLTRTRRLTLFEVDYKQTWEHWEAILFGCLGILCGFLGAAFVILNKAIHQRRVAGFARRDCFCWFLPSRLDRALQRAFHIAPGADSRVLEVALLAIITGISNWPRTLTRIPQNDAIFALFSQCHEDPGARTPGHIVHDPIGLCATMNTPNIGILGLLCAAAALRFLQTSMTFGALVPAGLFVPSLFIGGCVGRCLGVLLKFAGLPIEPGIYAMVGAGAMLAGVSRLTISLVVVLFELTGGLTYVVPFMVSVLTAKWVGDWMTDGQSVYDVHAEMNGMAKIEQNDDVALLNITMRDLFSSETGSSPEDVQKNSSVSSEPPALWTTHGLILVKDLAEHCSVAEKGFAVLSMDLMGDVEVIGWANSKHIMALLGNTPEYLLGAKSERWCRLTSSNPALAPLPLFLRCVGDGKLPLMTVHKHFSSALDLSEALNPRGVVRVRQDCPIQTGLCITQRCPGVQAFVSISGSPFTAHTMPREVFLARLVSGRVRALPLPA
jgi:H+/Cl- antiporter ClcA